jgi:hypothetical protein
MVMLLIIIFVVDSKKHHKLRVKQHKFTDSKCGDEVSVVEVAGKYTTYKCGNSEFSAYGSNEIIFIPSQHNPLTFVSLREMALTDCHMVNPLLDGDKKVDHSKQVWDTIDVTGKLTKLQYFKTRSNQKFEEIIDGKNFFTDTISGCSLMIKSDGNDKMAILHDLDNAHFKDQITSSNVIQPLAKSADSKANLNSINENSFSIYFVKTGKDITLLIGVTKNSRISVNCERFLFRNEDLQPAERSDLSQSCNQYNFDKCWQLHLKRE